MRSLLQDLSHSFRHTRFWVFSTWLDILARARMSRLGIVWLLLPSFLYIWGVGYLYAIIFRTPMSEFAVYVGVGTIVFRLVTGTIISSTGIYKSAKSYIMDGNVRLSDFVLRGISNNSFTFIMSIPAAAIAIAIYPQLSALGLLLAVVALPLIFINLLWIAVVFSLIGARHPDLSQLVPNVFMFFYLATPIIWTTDNMPPGSVRGHLLTFNPFYYLIEIVRAPIMHGRLDLQAMVVSSLMAVVGCLVAAYAYRRWASFVPLWI